MDASPAMQPNASPSQTSFWYATHGLLITALVTGAVFVPALRYWPWLWLVPLIAYGLIVAVVPPLRRTRQPFRFGSTDRLSVVATLVVILGSSAALLTFDAIVKPDLSMHHGFLREAAGQGLLLSAVVFSVVNAILEELVFRGILFDAFKSQLGVGMAIVATSILFGLGHLEGYPPGPIGAVMAGVYGLCLGGLRQMTGGLGLVIAAHIAADATIYYIGVRSAGLIS